MGSADQVEFGWFIPTTGDGPYIGIPPQREATQQYMTEVAQAAERAGYEFVLIPTGGDCLDAWVVGSWVAARTEKLKALVAMRPGLMSPVLAARMAATLDRVSEGRVLVNVVTGHYPADLQATGDPLSLSHDERYERTREFLHVVKGVWDPETPGGFDYKGRYYDIQGGQSRPALVTAPYPPLYFGGSSVSGKKVAAELADVYLMWAEPLEWIGGQISEMEGYLDERSRETGEARRTLRYGLRAQLVVRETEEEAWRAAWSILSQADPALLSSREKLHSRTDATNQKRQMDLWNDSRDNDYVIGPNLWSGLSAVRGGGAVAFVGTPDQVSDRLLEFVDAGVTSFILSGYPHLEEAEISGRLLMPVVKRKLAERAAAGAKTQTT
ncbi:LLM class flavin-dependent oxidoreductase [Cohnella thailandensis]|uniref:LLM class flavin-dependent oxidoreductase n=1 Tax=Cohnella thailandensis TaxID=557557 RepID=A0A841SZV5_9BACL|nr:LLM class flavin-dependent oxidoreductase [Cohnella thailandensis]MBB6637434.1 LLM class flavin-dependent oxidoreductase [Cohnella thailandensis]MBP1976764.1 alkanesulfonate monooxygenase [Cohnella thailandensis]